MTNTSSIDSKLIYQQMNQVMKEVGAIGKDATNSAQNYKFRGIDQFLNVLHPALVKHQVFMMPFVMHESHELKDVVRGNGKPGIDKHVHLKMTYSFYAVDGSNVSCTVVSEGIDSGDKATNKALSAALKYALIQTFTIPTDDIEESDASSPEILPSNKDTMNAKCHAQIAVLKEKKKWDANALVQYLKTNFNCHNFSALNTDELKQVETYLVSLEK